MAKSKSGKHRGPKPQTVTATGVDWKDALKHAMSKAKPKDGWPKPDTKQKNGPGGT